MTDFVDLTTARMEGLPVETAFTGSVGAPAVENNFPITCCHCGWKGQLCLAGKKEGIFCPQCMGNPFNGKGLLTNDDVVVVLARIIPEEEAKKIGEGVVIRYAQDRSKKIATILAFSQALIPAIATRVWQKGWLEPCK